MEDPWGEPCDSGRACLSEKALRSRLLNATEAVLPMMNEKQIRARLESALNDALSNHLPVSVSRLARALRMTPRNLHKITKKHYNLNPHRLIENWKLEKAARILVDFPALEIEDVAVKSGYRSVYTFYRSFRQRIRMTPSAWRTETGRMTVEELSSKLTSVLWMP